MMHTGGAQWSPGGAAFWRVWDGSSLGLHSHPQLLSLSLVGMTGCSLRSYSGFPPREGVPPQLFYPAWPLLRLISRMVATGLLRDRASGGRGWQWGYSCGMPFPAAHYVAHDVVPLRALSGVGGARCGVRGKTTAYLSEAQFAVEPPEALDPLYKFHETIAKVEA
ncbi:hypothetical protein NHX12_033102 [Muraenolepis orangiensis]|uniref:Uncharacterized protein n=1 Tax=Muraenolepis orangiensis TaxID=630683 RepID=A0A9Q0IHN8_9TELE|nr:hypothetical protein NHX12_033102 [Muraenolepis orangiensis]